MVLKGNAFCGKKAEMGVGTLIIFIALLLVAAVAAGVLIQTASSLQQKALETGRQATGQISSNAIAIEVSAEDGQARNVTNFSMIMKLAAGSDQIKLEDVTMSFSTADTATTYKYTSGTKTNYTVNAAQHNGTFDVTYLQTGTNSIVGNLQRGDVIRIDFCGEREILEDEQVMIRFIPKIGTPTQVNFVTPEVISTKRVYLYP